MAETQRQANRSAVRRKTSGTIKSDFAILDVKGGRAALKKHFDSHIKKTGDHYAEAARIPVLVRGYIEAVHSGDDGVSREFSMTVTSVLETGKRKVA